MIKPQIKFFKKKPLICFIGAMAMSATTLYAGVDVVARPETTSTNGFYISNRAPLEPSEFIPLPIDLVHPKGWLLEIMKRQRAGLCGHLDEISIWLSKDDNAWLNKNGKGKYGWEEVPYWLRGYIQLAYIFNDPKMIAESRVWINGVLNSQRPNGDFGPDQTFDDDHTRDFWANMLMMFCLETYYEHSHDSRVIDLMTKYFKYHLTIPDNQFLTHYWQKMRGGDELYSIYWLYNRTGDAFLVDLADKVHRCTADWEMGNTLPNWHNVNIAESFREPAEHSLLTRAVAELQDTYADFNVVRKLYGQVPGGMFGADENCRPGYSDPRQAIETCGMVEQMLSDELLVQISGDPFWADNCEDVAFNTYPAALTPDMRALRYLTAPNVVVSDAQNHSPGIQNDGPFLLMNPFSARCCQHNHSMGWPYFAKHLWLATPDNGLGADVYSASEVTARVGDGELVKFDEITHYPFDETIQFKLHVDEPVAFPLYLRIPGWCQSAEVSVNGNKLSVTSQADKYVRIEREWKNNDEVTLDLPMEISVHRWTDNHDSVSVNYGPLTFSLKIGETIKKLDSTKTAIGDSGWQKTADPEEWPSFSYHPATPWNYGLMLDGAHPEKSFIIKKLPWPKDDYPFTPASAPIEILAKGRQIPEWTVDKYGLCAVLQQSPAWSDQPVQNLPLIPMGATRLRISAFPTVSDLSDAHKWHPSLDPDVGKSANQASASHCYSGDTVNALCDGIVPHSSDEQDIPRFTWWDHRGTAEWVQYDFPAPKKISGAEVYWFDDTGNGQCRVPASWRLLCKSDDVWQPLGVAADFIVKKDDWNRVTFPAVETRQLRLEVKLQPEFSGGILEWRVRP
jgi:hypothetical protein